MQFQVNPWQNSNAIPQTITDGEVHIWRINLNATPQQIQLAKETVSPEELQNGIRFVTEDLRRRYFIAHASKRRILSHYVGYPALDLSFRFGEYGKPYLQIQGEDHKLKFNLSHSADMALLAVTLNSEIGVDIEHIDSNIDVLPLAKRFFAPIEYERLLRLQPLDQIAGFYRIWTLKEAVIKALGKGISCNLASFAVKLIEDYQHCLDYMVDQKNTNDWSVFTFNAAPQFAAALALTDKMKHCSRWDNDFLLL